MNRKELQAREIWLIDLIEREGERDGLLSMAEHPRYRELVKIQGLLYPVIAMSEVLVIHKSTITQNIGEGANGKEKAIERQANVS